MSLINQMLKDLESRHRPSSEAQGAISGMVGSQQGAPRHGLMLGLIAVVVLMGATLGYLLWPIDPVTAPEQQTAKAEAPEIVTPEPEQKSPFTPQEQAQETTDKGAPSTPVLVEKHQPSTEQTPVQIAQQPVKTTPEAPVRKAAQPSTSRPVSMDIAEEDGDQRIEKRIHPLRPAQIAEQRYQAGYRRMQQGDHRGAEAQWQKALEADPTDIPSREALAALYLAEGRRVEASEQLQQGLDYHPGYGQFALLYARLQMGNGDNASAIQVMEHALEEQQQSADFYAFLAAIYQQSKEYAKSIAAYQRALNLKPKQSVWWMGIGISLEGAGKSSEAVTAYHEAIDSGRLTPKLRDFVKGRLQMLE